MMGNNNSSHPLSPTSNLSPPPLHHHQQDSMEAPDSSSSSTKRLRLDHSFSTRHHNNSSFPTKPKNNHFTPFLRRSATTTTNRRIKVPPPEPKKVTLYVTSLQGVRRTFEDCRAVRSILRCLHVAIDERDLAMDPSFRRELQSLLPDRPLSLPQAFVGRRWLGGADEIRRLYEDGELAVALDGVAAVEDPAFVCHVCGGARFVPCLSCSGSRKVFVEEEGQLRRCSVCNENGLVRCVNCY